MDVTQITEVSKGVMGRRTGDRMAVVDGIAEVVAGANHSEIARRTGIHLSHVNRILNRKRTASSKNLAAIATVLGVRMDELYTYLTRTGKGKKAA